MMTEHKLARILRAIADGKIVQSKLVSRNVFSGDPIDLGWKDLDVSQAFSLFPTNPNVEYRIKPKPVVKKWKWLIDLNPKGNQHLYITPTHFSSKEKILEITPFYKVLQRMDETLIEEEED